MDYNFLKSNLAFKQRVMHVLGPADDAGFSAAEEQTTLVNFKKKLLALRGEKFLIVGDYDCDGITATAILKRLLTFLNINHNYYIPSRIKDGYGLNVAMVERAREYGFGVILCVDNGVSALEALNKAKEYGIQVLIIDHHEYQNVPECEAFLHTNLLTGGYRDLCGGGLSYLLSTLFYEDNLSLVYGGLATLADMVSVLGYNRYLLKRMLEILNRERIYQIDLLTDRKIEVYDYEDLSFQVIPKINAISRMEPQGNANMMVRYLLSDYVLCQSASRDIRNLNDERKRLTNEYGEEAKKSINEDDRAIVVYNPEFRDGLLGVLANRLMSECGKPVFVLNGDGEFLKGSARSPEGIDLYGLMSEYRELFSTFGGHECALGFSLSKEHFEEFKAVVSGLDISSTYHKDVIELYPDELRGENLRFIDSLKPFGTDYKEPLFYLANPSFVGYSLMAHKYPKYVLAGGVNAISFNEKHAGKAFDVMIGHLKRDSYRKSSLSFMIEDLC